MLIKSVRLVAVPRDAVLTCSMAKMAPEVMAEESMVMMTISDPDALVILSVKMYQIREAHLMATLVLSLYSEVR